MHKYNAILAWRNTTAQPLLKFASSGYVSRACRESGEYLTKFYIDVVSNRRTSHE
jgi:hypothetical protein